MITIHLKNTSPYALTRFPTESNHSDTGKLLTLEQGHQGILCPELTVNLFEHRFVCNGKILPVEEAIHLFLSSLAETNPSQDKPYLPYPGLRISQPYFFHTESERFKKARNFCNQPWVVAKGLDGDPDLTICINNDTITLQGMISQTLSLHDFVHPRSQWGNEHIYTPSHNRYNFSLLTSFCFSAGTALSWQQNNPNEFNTTPFDFDKIKDVFCTSYDLFPLFHTDSQKTIQLSREHKLKSRHTSAPKRREASEELFLPLTLMLMRAGWVLNQGWAPTKWIKNTPFWDKMFEEKRAKQWFQSGQEFGALNQHKDVDVARFFKEKLQNQ